MNKYEANAIILSGGKCRRISTEKSFIKLGSETLIETIINVLHKIFSDIIIVANHSEKYSGLAVQKVVKDIIPEKGPLGGIYTGLKISDTQYNFIIACDMPFINPFLISLLLENNEGYDIVVPAYNGFFEPLYAVYSKNCTEVILEQLKNNELKIIDIYPKLKTNVLVCDDHFFSEKTFFNVNTPEDLILAKNYLKIAGEKHVSGNSIITT